MKAVYFVCSSHGADCFETDIVMIEHSLKLVRQFKVDTLLHRVFKLGFKTPVLQGIRSPVEQSISRLLRPSRVQNQDELTLVEHISKPRT